MGQLSYIRTTVVRIRSCHRRFNLTLIIIFYCWPYHSRDTLRCYYNTLAVITLVVLAVVRKRNVSRRRTASIYVLGGQKKKKKKFR